MTDFPTLITKLESAEEEIKRLREALVQIEIAAEFHAQAGVADHVMRYAHESTARLCRAALKARKESAE